MIIWGFKTYVTVLAMATAICARCGNPAAHRLHQAVRKFTLFFIPLFPISRKYVLDCTFCGTQSKLTKEQADQFVASQHAPAVAPPPPAAPAAPPPPSYLPPPGAGTPPPPA